MKPSQAIQKLSSGTSVDHSGEETFSFCPLGVERMDGGSWRATSHLGGKQSEDLEAQGRALTHPRSVVYQRSWVMV